MKLRSKVPGKYDSPEGLVDETNTVHRMVGMGTKVFGAGLLTWGAGKALYMLTGKPVFNLASKTGIPVIVTGAFVMGAGGGEAVVLDGLEITDEE